MKVLLDPINLTTKSEQATFWIACLKTSWKCFYFNSAHQVCKKKKKEKACHGFTFPTWVTSTIPFLSTQAQVHLSCRCYIWCLGDIHTCPGQTQPVFPPQTQIPMTAQQKRGGKKMRSWGYYISLRPTTWFSFDPLSLVSPPSSLYSRGSFTSWAYEILSLCTFPSYCTIILARQENI